MDSYYRFGGVYCPGSPWNDKSLLGMMVKRKRKYRCIHCGKIQLRVTDKQWVKSYCEISEKYVHLVLVNELELRTGA